MRFHCGFSFKPKTKWFFIGLGFLALFFSNILKVNAEVFNDAPNMYYFKGNVESAIFPTVLTSSSDYYYYPNNGNGFNAREFTTIYYFNQSASNVICPSGFADISTRVSLLDTSGNYINDGLNFTQVTNGTIQLASIQNGYADITFKNVDLTKNLKFVTNASYSGQTAVGIFAVHKPLTITCLTSDWQYIVNNNNENTETIINNNNTNTQNIIDSQEEIKDSVDDLNDNLMEGYDGSAGGHQFILPTENYPSTIQGMFNLPVDLLRTVVNNADTCTPYQLDFSSITQRWGGFDYVLTLPCLRTKLNTLLGFVYTLADYLLAFYLFYNMAMYVLQLIDAITSGTDLFSYLYHGSNNNNNNDNGSYGHYNRRTGEVVD